MIGRAYLYGMGAAGEAGVAQSINILRAEIARALTLLGSPTLSDLDRSILRAPATWGMTNDGDHMSDRKGRGA